MRYAVFSSQTISQTIQKGRTMNKRPKNWRRELIIKNNLIAHLDNLTISDKNKSIILDYSKGLSYGDISKKYSISSSRAEEVIQNFFYHLSKNGIYKYWQDEVYFELMLEQIKKDMKD